MATREHILMDISPNEFLRLIGQLDDFDRGGRIRVYYICAILTERLKQ
jgi:hypothetical protein